MRGSNRIRQTMSDLFRQMWNETYYDRQKGEVVATKEYFALGIEQGEVLKDSRNCRQFDLNETMRKWYQAKQKKDPLA